MRRILLLLCVPWGLNYVSAMMDIRHFALPNPPRMPDFVDPGVAPPSFILSPGQLQPPYDLSATDIPEPSPSCVADYASVCSVQHAIRLVTRTKAEACSELAAGGARRQKALDNITAGYFYPEGTTGFGVFALDPDGYFIADALRPSFVGELFNGYMNAGLVADSTVLEYIAWVVRWGGGFVPHLSTRLAASPVDVLAGGSPEQVTAYMEACDNGDRLGVAFKRAPLPSVTDCSSQTNNFCAMQTVRRIVGLNLVDALNTFSFHQLVQMYYDVTYGEAYRVGDYYVWAYQINWVGYPGPDPYENPSPLENTLGTCLGHGSSYVQKTLNGLNVTQWYTGGEPPAPTGYLLQYYSFAPAWSGGGFLDYIWYNPTFGWHYKLGYEVGYVWNSTAYMVGGGLLHIPESAALGPRCSQCTDASLPCAILNSWRLAAHASAEYQKIGSTWGPISNSTWFGSMHDDADDNDGQYAGTWPWGTYVFAFDWSGVCVADGKTKANIGQSVVDILGSWETHERFKTAASNAGWLQYDLPDGTTRIAKVVKEAQNGTWYYLATSYQRLRANFSIEYCSSYYAEPCVEDAIQALVGEAASEMLASEDVDTLQQVIDNVTSQEGLFREDVFGDFVAYVFDDEWNCASGVACPELPTNWITSLSEVGMNEEAAWLSLDEVAGYEASLAWIFQLEWSSPISPDHLQFHIVVFVTDAPGPPTCTSGTDCPDNAECNSGRCDCKYGFLNNFTTEASVCGEVPASSLQCVDVRNKLCVGLECEDCPAGYFCPIGSVLACTEGFVCPAGSSPQACPKGQIANSTGKLLTSLADCDDCPAGSFNDAEGQTSCADCSVGTSQSDSGSSACERCGIGYYQDATGSRTCQKCPGLLTTLYTGAASLSDCICPHGTYEVLGTTECRTCPEGMDCPDNATEAAIPAIGENSAWPHPVALAGYMVLPEAPMAAYECKDESWCVGGPPGSCAKGRDQYVVGCAKCETGKFTTQEGPCEDCDSGAVFILVSTVSVGVVVALGVFAHAVNRNQLNQSAAMLVVVITLGLTVTAIQTLGIFASLSVSWTEPLRSMFKVLALVSFDLKVLKAECVVGNQSVTNMIARQLVAPACGCYVAVIVFVKKEYNKRWHHQSERLDFTSQVMNAVGAIFQVFFVAILLSALMPLICYEHPNNLGHSMVNDPSVLCNNAGDHLSLVMVSIATLVLVVIPYLAVTASATVGYRARMGRTSASRHLQMFRFLFFRYQPYAYYYGVLTLIRGTLVCLVPVVFRDAPSLQLLFMATILLSFCGFQLHLKPWRGSLPNWVDASSNLLMVLLIVAVAMTTDFDDADSMLGIFSGIIFVCLFAGIAAVAGFNIYKFFRPKPFFANFLCHHKAQAAAQARYLQTLIVLRSRNPCFLDSDNLSNLEELFDIVRTRCGRLIVYLTADTLRRPWCAGEISIAFQTHRRLASVVHPSFLSPNIEQLEAQHISSYLAASDFKLVEYGVTDDVISQAYRWLLCDNAQKFDMPCELVGRARFEAVVNSLVRKASVHPNQASSLPASISTSTPPDAVISTSTPSKSSQTNRLLPPAPAGNTASGNTLRPKCLVVSSLPGDDEAIASAAVLVGKIQEAVLDLVPAGLILLADVQHPDHLEALDTILSAHALIVILTAGSLHCTEQLQHIVDAFSEDVPCIPVNTPNFSFPGQDYFEHDLPLRFGKETHNVESKVRQLLKSITVPFTTYGSQQVLDVQADAVVQRIPRQPASAPLSPVGSRNSGKRQLDLLQAEQSASISRLSTTQTHPLTRVFSENSSILRIGSGQSHGATPAPLVAVPVADEFIGQYVEIDC